MSICNGKTTRLGSKVFTPVRSIVATRYFSSQHDDRNRLSTFWAPAESLKKDVDQDLLSRAGVLRQAHSGIFHLLPLGLRIQDKIERLIDKHMRSLGASKVSLSSLSSEQLWSRSGRLEGRDSEFLRLSDRKGAKYLLSPTHEEEITTIVGNAVKTYKELPLRVYQVSRKYRDEARPRQGLLRAREFVMKDLYTFDTTKDQAEATYKAVCAAYNAFFGELRLPFLVAAADSGNMGGTLSHEYHFSSSAGEDLVINCHRCGFAANEEVFLPAAYNGNASTTPDSVQASYGISKDRKHLYHILVPAQTELNLHVVKRIIPGLDTSVSDPLSLWKGLPDRSEQDIHYLIDPRCHTYKAPDHTVLNHEDLILTKPQTSDKCPACGEEALAVTQTVEIGHTFDLGTRYSEPLNAKVLDASNQLVPMQMGCHGIGVSRLIAAASGLLADAKGLNWPLAIAPFRVLILAAPSAPQGDIENVYDTLLQSTLDGAGVDAIIDDRQKSLGYKLNDADVVGYPFIVVLGRSWTQEKKVELQCRRLGYKDTVTLDALTDTITDLSKQL